MSVSHMCHVCLLRLLRLSDVPHLSLMCHICLTCGDSSEPMTAPSHPPGASLVYVQGRLSPSRALGCTASVPPSSSGGVYSPQGMGVGRPRWRVKQLRRARPGSGQIIWAADPGAARGRRLLALGSVPPSLCLEHSQLPFPRPAAGGWGGKGAGCSGIPDASAVYSTLPVPPPTPGFTPAPVPGWTLWPPPLIPGSFSKSSGQ